MSNPKKKQSEPEAKKPSYLSGVFSYSDKQHSIELRYRASVKWIFDYIRNMMIVGVILFLGKTSDNWILIQFGYVGCGLLWMYLVSYIEPLTVRPFHHLKNKRLGNGLDIAFFILIVMPIAVAVQFGLIGMVDQIADAYLSK